MMLFRNKIVATGQHIVTNAEKLYRSSKTLKKSGKRLEQDDLAVFELSLEEPPLSLEKYLERLASFQEISDQEIKVSIMIFVQIVEEYWPLLKKLNHFEFKLLAGCFCVAYKFIDDVSLVQEDLAHITCLETRELANLEFIVLRLLTDADQQISILDLHPNWRKVIDLSYLISKPLQNPK